jgi:hypothetical protein
MLYRNQFVIAYRRQVYCETTFFVKRLLLVGSSVGELHFFSDSDPEIFFDHFRIRILRLYWYDNFLKSGTHIACTCIPEPVKQKKMCYREKKNLFYLKRLTSDFSELFLFYGSIWIRIRTFSNSDPAKTFVFGSTILVGSVETFFLSFQHKICFYRVTLESLFSPCLQTVWSCWTKSTGWRPGKMAIWPSGEPWRKNLLL